MAKILDQIKWGSPPIAFRRFYLTKIKMRTRYKGKMSHTEFISLQAKWPLVTTTPACGKVPDWIAQVRRTLTVNDSSSTARINCGTCTEVNCSFDIIVLVEIYPLLWQFVADPATIKSYLHKYMVDDWESITFMGEYIKGMENLTALVLNTLTAFPDIKLHIVDTFCEGNDIDGYKTTMPVIQKFRWAEQTNCQPTNKRRPTKQNIKQTKKGDPHSHPSWPPPSVWSSHWKDANLVRGPQLLCQEHQRKLEVSTKVSHTYIALIF